jgi:hexokinase
MITVVLGSFADMPTDLKEQIEKLEEAFTIPTTKLKEISDHFLGELKRGLSKEGGTIVGRNASDITDIANEDSP